MTNSSSLFKTERGQTYKDFWGSVSETKEGAVFAVVGTPFDRDATDESLLLSGEPEVQIITDKLHIGPESRVLEIGCGVGRLAYHMASRCRGYVGADIAANMLDLARKQTEGFDNVELHELHEAAPLPFEDETFDAVFAQAVFIHLDREDCYRYIKEAHRVLRPGGRAYFQWFNLLNEEGFRLFDWVATHTVKPEGKVRGRVHCLTNVEAREYVRRCGFDVDEAASDLEPSEQDFDFPMPTINFDYYLIAVGEKPPADGEPARLLPRDRRVRCEHFADEYHRYYLDGFFSKVGRHNETEPFEKLVDYLRTLPPETAFRAALEIERGAMRLRHAGRSELDIIPALYAAAEGSGDEPLWQRVRRETGRLLP